MAARHHKSDWGKSLGCWNFPCSKVTWPKHKCISIFRTCTVDSGWLTWASITFSLVDQSSPNFFVQWWKDHCWKSCLPLVDNFIHSRDICGQTLKSSEIVLNLACFSLFRLEFKNRTHFPPSSKILQQSAKGPQKSHGEEKKKTAVKHKAFPNYCSTPN